MRHTLPLALALAAAVSSDAAAQPTLRPAPGAPTTLTPQQAVEALRERADDPLVAEYIEFIVTSKRGICHGSGRATRGTIARAVKGEGAIEALG